MDYSVEYGGGESLYADHFRVLDRFQTEADVLPLLLPFERRIVALLAEKGINSLADLGCGTGRFLRAAEQVTGSAVGFEVAGVLVEQLQKYGRSARRGGILEFLSEGIRPEAVSLLEVVEHLTNPGELVGRILREKSPRLLFVVVPDSATRRCFDRRFAEHDVPPNHLSWWSPKSLAALLAHQGYKVSIETVQESRRSLLGHLYRNGNMRTAAGVLEWMQAFVSPPNFWLLGIAEKE